MSWLIKMIQWWQSLCWSVDGFCVWLWLWAWQGPVLTVSWCLWYRGNQAVMGSPRPWDPDTIHRAGSSSKSHYITNNLIPTYIKLYLWQNTIKCFTLLQEPYESTILSVYLISCCQLSRNVLKLLGFEFEHLQQWLESRLWRDQFLNFSTVIPRVWARPRLGRVMLSSVTHTGGTFTDKETQKSLWKQEKNTFDLGHNWRFLFNYTVDESDGDKKEMRTWR